MKRYAWSSAVRTATFHGLFGLVAALDIERFELLHDRSDALPISTETLALLAGGFWWLGRRATSSAEAVQLEP